MEQSQELREKLMELGTHPAIIACSAGKYSGKCFSDRIMS